MKGSRTVLGKFFYAGLFLLLIPAIIIYWAKFTQEIIKLPKIESKLGGAVLLIAGGCLLGWSMFTIMKFGKGLPMNAYPPSRLVTIGPYRLFRHPIYWGFAIMLVGYFISIGSASGLWFVTPLVILGMVTLVLGYESLDLKRRFPNQTVVTITRFPEKEAKLPSGRDRLISAVWIVAGIVFCNFILFMLVGEVASRGEQSSWLFFDNILPYYPILSFTVLLAVPIILRRKDSLREWLISGIFALGLYGYLGLLFPEFGAQYFTSGQMVLFTAPEFLILISLRLVFKESRKVGIAFFLIAFCIGCYHLFFSTSPVANITNSLFIFLLAAYRQKVWGFLRNFSEKIANSWKEWIFGKIRIINHGFYIGFGVGFGVLLAGILAGKEYGLGIFVFTMIVTITSALWAQLIEGSDKLKRPFGYYGGLVGIPFGCLAIWAMDLHVWVIIGVASVVMPWIQAIGRLRCLVNGCCHGRKVDDPEMGIRYYHPRSRVCKISGLKGEFLYPTQLFSLLWLLLVGLIMLKLWHNNLPYSFIFGLYLILTGLGRFVEEAYRGEVQTPNIRSLHLYQWTAIVSVIIGIIMTTIRVNPEMMEAGFNWESLVIAAVSGFLLFFAMGVDFPYSNARFARLV